MREVINYVTFSSLLENKSDSRMASLTTVHTTRSKPTFKHLGIEICTLLATRIRSSKGSNVRIQLCVVTATSQPTKKLFTTLLESTSHPLDNLSSKADCTLQSNTQSQASSLQLPSQELEIAIQPLQTLFTSLSRPKNMFPLKGKGELQSSLNSTTFKLRVYRILSIFGNQLFLAQLAQVISLSLLKGYLIYHRSPCVGDTSLRTPLVKVRSLILQLGSRACFVELTQNANQFLTQYYLSF